MDRDLDDLVVRGLVVDFVFGRFVVALPLLNLLLVLLRVVRLLLVVHLHVVLLLRFFDLLRLVDFVLPLVFVVLSSVQSQSSSSFSTLHMHLHVLMSKYWNLLGQYL